MVFFITSPIEMYLLISRDGFLKDGIRIDQVHIDGILSYGDKFSHCNKPLFCDNLVQKS